jgi:hypothetical protein
MKNKEKTLDLKKKLGTKANLFFALNKLPKNYHQHIIQHLDDDSIDAICECVYNVIYTDISLLPTRTKKTLAKNLHKHCCVKNLRTIATSSISVSKRRKALQQEGTGIGLILSTIVPLIAKLFT